MVPDFTVRLQAAMDYAGLDAKQVAGRLTKLGIRSRTQQVNRCLKGDLDPATGQRKRVNPTFVLIGGLAKVCQVSAAWFFDATIDPRDMIDRYGERAASEDA